MAHPSKILQPTLPENTKEVKSMEEFVDTAIEQIQNGKTDKVINFLESLEGKGRAKYPSLSGLGQHDYYGYFANSILKRYSNVKAPEYSAREEINLISIGDPKNALWKTFLEEYPDIDHKKVKVSYEKFCNSWSHSPEETAPLQEFASRRKGHENAFSNQNWWPPKENSDSDIEAIQAYTEFQQNFIRDAFKPKNDQIYGFRSFKDPKVLEDAHIDEEFFEIHSAPIEHWSTSPVDSSHYARDDIEGNHGYIIAEKIDLNDIAGASLGSDAFPLNISELFVMRNKTENYPQENISTYEEADLIEMAVKAAHQVGEIPENLEDKYIY